MTPRLRESPFIPAVSLLCILRLRCCDYPPPQNHFQLSGNETQRQTEFLGVLAASQVDVSTLEEPLQALCQDRSIHWTKRADGKDSQTSQANNIACCVEK